MLGDARRQDSAFLEVPSVKHFQFITNAEKVECTLHGPLFPTFSNNFRYLSRDAPSSRADISASYRVDAPEESEGED